MSQIVFPPPNQAFEGRAYLYVHSSLCPETRLKHDEPNKQQRKRDEALKLGGPAYSESDVASGPPREVLLELPPLWGPPRPTSGPCLKEPSHRGEKRLNAREGPHTSMDTHTGQRDRYREMRWETMLVSIATRTSLHELGTQMCRVGAQRPSAHSQADSPVDVRWLRGTHLGEDQHSMSFIP